VAAPITPDAAELRRLVRSSHPPFVEAVVADARLAARFRDDPHVGDGALAMVREVLRLCLVTDAFFAQTCYRAKAAAQAKGIPFLPRVLHRFAMRSAQVCIGDPVVVEAGVYIPHGQVVLDALTRVRTGTTLSPFVTLGRVASRPGGPDVGPLATIGTGAKVLGPVKVGARAQVGANSVVLDDVPPDATAVGAPARVVSGD
jgi:serine O-acetyltransferase